MVYGGAALTVNRPHEAIAAYTSPDVTVAAIGGYPPFWEHLAFAHHLLGEYRQELDVATRGRKQHPEHLLLLYAERAGPDSGALAQRLALVRAMYTAGRYEQARAIVATLPGGADNPAVLGYQGVLAARRRDRPAALAADTALAALRDPYLSGANTLWRARIAAVLGERERTVALLRAAFDEGQPYVWFHADPDFLALRDDPLFRGVIRPKG